MNVSMVEEMPLKVKFSYLLKSLLNSWLNYSEFLRNENALILLFVLSKRGGFEVAK